MARLRAAHTAAGLLTVAAALVVPAAHADRRPGGPVVLDVLGWLLQAALAVAAGVVVGAVCRRGRSEKRLDRRIDRHLVRQLPLAAVVLLVLAAVYAGWSRPGWRSAGRLQADVVFAALTLLQGLLVVVLAVVAHLLYRTHRPASRTAGDATTAAPAPAVALRGLGGPVVAMLACALGGVMTGGVAQRVSDWLDGTGHFLPGPPVLLTWQASVIPPLLLVLLVLGGRLAGRTLRRARAERAAVAREHPGEAPDAQRTRQIARVRALATLTDDAPLVAGAVAAVTLLLGVAAVVGALLTDRTPARAAADAPALVAGAAETVQALGSWLTGLGFLAFVTSGRRAYKHASARRTIGILWDVGTFWPRAAHPFAPPCYAERVVPDLTWRVTTWTRATGGRLVLSGHSQGSVLVAAAAWQLPPSVRRRVALLTYGSPLTRLYGRWFPAHFGQEALASLHRDIVCWRNLYRPTDPIGGPVRLPEEGGPAVDRAPLKDPWSTTAPPGTRCPSRSWATATTRPTRPSPRSAGSCWTAWRPRCPRRVTAPGSPPNRTVPGRPAPCSGWTPDLRAVPADPRGRAASDRRCPGRRAAPPGPHAAPPSPRRSAARYGRCRTCRPSAAR